MYHFLMQHLVFALLIVITSTASAVEKISVIGLFAEKAIVEIDGKRRTLSKGKKSPEGVMLISTQQNEIVLEIEGKQSIHRIGANSSAQYKKPKKQKVRILKNNHGMFTTTGSINGQLINFLVDTGATFVSLNQHQAKKLGIQFRYKGKKIPLSTANGITTGYKIKLKYVKVGSIKLFNIDAVVMSGKSTNKALLGMSFLGKLNMENRDDMLILKKKY